MLNPNNLCPKNLVVKTILGLKNIDIKILLLVKIGSLTAEIFLIWTDVARTNVAWTFVTVKVGICER